MTVEINLKVNDVPIAEDYFVQSFIDHTVTTTYFKQKTSSELFNSFKPEISQSMNEVGVTKAYKDMMGRYTSLIPFGGAEYLNLDNYVTNKALDGLFYQLGQEEAKIRTNPAARTTDLLKKVFGK